MEHWSGLYVLSANEVGSYITSEGRENRCQLLLFPRPVRESVPPVEIEIFGPRVSIRFFFFSFFSILVLFSVLFFFFVAVGPRSFRSIQRTVAAVWNGSRAPYISKMQKKQNKKRRRSSSYWDFVLDFTFCWPARRHLRKSDPQREGRYPTTVPKRGGRTKRGSMVLPSIMTMILRPPPFVSLFVFFCTSTGCSLNG